MIWVISLILVLLAAYFLFKGLRARHVARSHYVEKNDEKNNLKTTSDLTRSTSLHGSQAKSNQTEKNPADSAANTTAQFSGEPAEINEVNASNTATAVGDLSNNAISSTSIDDTHSDELKVDEQRSDEVDLTPLEKVPPPHDAPSLLYAERDFPRDAAGYPLHVNDDDSTQDNAANQNAVNRSPINTSASASNDATAEHSTDKLSTAEVASASVRHSSVQDSSVQDGSVQDGSAQEAAAQTRSTQHSDVEMLPEGSKSASALAETPENEKPSTAATTDNRSTIAATAAGTATAAMAASRLATDKSSNGIAADTVSTDNSATGFKPRHSGTYTTEVDLELGDATLDDDDNDDLLDFGDLTADISEMLKELNLRESDSPRLEINESEFQQLKTGDPGDVKHEKIENVAGKLRNMLD